MNKKGQVEVILSWLLVLIFEGIIIALAETTNYSATINLIIHIGVPVAFLGSDMAAFLALAGVSNG